MYLIFIWRQSTNPSGTKNAANIDIETFLAVTFEPVDTFNQIWRVDAFSYAEHYYVNDLVTSTL